MIKKKTISDIIMIILFIAAWAYGAYYFFLSPKESTSNNLPTSTLSNSNKPNSQVSNLTNKEKPQEELEDKEQPKKLEHFQLEFWQTVTLKQLKEKLKTIENINQVKLKNGGSMLHYLMISKNPKILDMITLLIEAGINYDMQDTQYGSTALVWACYFHAPLSSIKFLVEKGANPLINTTAGSTLLQVAVSSENNKINPALIQYLLSLDFDVTKKDKEGKSALDYMKQNKEFRKTEIFKKISNKQLSKK